MYKEIAPIQKIKFMQIMKKKDRVIANLHQRMSDGIAYDGVRNI